MLFFRVFGNEQDGDEIFFSDDSDADLEEEKKKSPPLVMSESEDDDDEVSEIPQPSTSKKSTKGKKEVNNNVRSKVSVIGKKKVCLTFLIKNSL